MTVNNPEMMRELIGLDDPLPYVEEYAGPTYVEGKA